MFFKPLQHFFCTHRRMLFFGFSATWFILIPSTSFAASWIEEGLTQLLYGLALGIGGLFTGLGALLLDLSFLKVVLEFGTLVGPQSDLGIGVQGLWQVVRDILNILFIFGFIYMGIKTILNSEDSGTRKTLGLLIIAALLINFSLYITQVIVDFSNIAAVQIYNQISFQGGEDTTTFAGLFPVGKGSITSAFLDVAGVSSIFSGDLPKDSTIDLGSIAIFSIFMMFFLIITGIVFAMGAFLLISRFIALVIYMILSPVMFLGFILPSLASKQKEWWGGFLKQAFFAPAFLFMLYLSLVVLQRLRGIIGISSDAAFTDMVGGAETSASFFTLLLFFAMMIGFLYASIKVGQMMGVAGAAGSLKALDNMGKAARGAALGYAYRTTVGRGLSGLVKGMDALDRRAESEKGTSGRGAARFARTILGGEATRRNLEKGSNYGAGGGQGWADLEKDQKTREARTTRSNQTAKIKSRIEEGAKARNILSTTHGPFTPAQQAVMDAHEKTVREMERSIRDASSAQLLEMAEKPGGEELILGISGSLSASQVKALTDSDKLTDAFKDKLGDERARQIGARISADEYGKANKADLGALGPDKLAEPAIAVQLSEKTIDALDFADIDKDMIKREREKALVNVARGATVGTFTLDKLKKMKPVDIAELPNDVFTVTDSFTKTLSAAALSEIGRKKNDATQSVIRATLQREIDSTTVRTNPADNDRLDAINTWFTTSPWGAMFGK